MLKKETDHIVVPDTTSKKTIKHLIQNIQWRPLPPLVVAILLITTSGVMLQILNPGVFLALRRDPAALSGGEWWRVITPLFVNDGNPFWHFAYDTVGFLLIGTVTERLFGSVRWFILLLAGATAGTIAGYLWDPYGAGSSIALCGLIGGFVTWQIRRNDFHLFASIYALGLALILVCEAIVTVYISNTFVGMLVIVVICYVGSNLLLLLHRQKPAAPISAYFVGGGVLLSALILIVMRDIHGIALLTGLVIALLILWRAPKHAAASL